MRTDRRLLVSQHIFEGGSALAPPPGHINTPWTPPVDRMTHACENITFPIFRMRAVINNCYQTVFLDVDFSNAIPLRYRYDDPLLAKRLALVLGVALVVGAVLFFLSSACWLWIFDSADEKKKRKYRKAQQRRLVRTTYIPYFTDQIVVRNWNRISASCTPEGIFEWCITIFLFRKLFGVTSWDLTN